MATTLKLTGVQAISGGTLDLNGTNASIADIALLPGWRPRVAKRRRGVLGGKWYEDVVESIPLRIYGSTELECVTALETLAAAMDQARSWKDGAAVDVVILAYAINGTTLANPLQTAVLGTPADAADILDLPVEFNRNLQVFEVNPVTLPLERRGLWLADEESQVSSSAAENPVVNTAAFTGSLTTPGPVDVVIELTSGNGNSTETGAALVFVADDADKIYVSRKQFGFNVSGAHTITDDHADADASDNEVLQIVPNDTGTVRFEPDADHTFPATAGSHTYMFFIVLKNYSASVYWDIYQLGYYRPGSETSNFRTLTNVRVAADNNNPQIVSIGPLFFDHPIRVDASAGILPSFYLQPSAGSGAGHELEIDTLAIVEMGAGVTPLTLRDVNFTSVDNRVVIDHALLSRLKPEVYTGLISSAVSDHSISYDGTPHIYNNTAEIAALVLGIQDDNWLLGHNPGAGYAPVSVNIKATRRPAYLVPR